MTRGGRREGAGRPKGSPNQHPHDPAKARTGRIVISCTEGEKRVIKELADEAGMSVSEYVLKRCMERCD